MEKRFIGISVPKKPREKGKHAKEIAVSELAEISFKEQLSESEYNAILSEGFTVWLAQAFEQNRKKKAI